MLNQDRLLGSHKSQHHYLINKSTHATTHNSTLYLPFRALLGTCNTFSVPLCTKATRPCTQYSIHFIKILPVIPVIAAYIIVISDLDKLCYNLYTCDISRYYLPVLLHEVFNLCSALLPCLNIAILFQLHSDALVYDTISVDRLQLTLNILLAQNSD